MAVITRYIVVRNGIERDRVFSVKKEADAYDKMLDAAENLADFIKSGQLEVAIDANAIDAIAVLLAKKGPEVVKILKGVKPVLPPSETEAAKTPPASRQPPESKPAKPGSKKRRR